MTSTNRPTSWDKKFLEEAKMNASWSKDPSTGVGAVIVNKSNNRQVAQGFNGFPSKIPDRQDWLEDRDMKYKVMIHAELNALLNATASDLSDHTIYVYPFAPCSNCALAIIQTGISRVVTLKPEAEKLARWKESFEFAEMLFEISGVELVVYDEL